MIEVDVGAQIYAVAFTPDGEAVVSGGRGIRVWQLESGQQMATMSPDPPKRVDCLVVSKNGRWIAAGTSRGNVSIWDAITHERVFSCRESHKTVHGVDFSPDATRLIAATDDDKATIWDVTARRRMFTLTLGHEGHCVRAVKYSQRGDLIAMATSDSTLVSDSRDGQKLVQIPVGVTPYYNTGLAWSNDYLFVVVDNKIRKFHATTGSSISEWTVPTSNYHSCIALPYHGEFVVYSTNRIIMFWSTSTYTQLGIMERARDIHSIALSPDGQLIATSGTSERIVVENLCSITDSIPLTRLHPTLQEPDIRIDDSVLSLWKHDKLAQAEILLTTVISMDPNRRHHMLASRALIRARMRQWGAAIDDARQSINIQRSLIGYIAKSVALVGNGEDHEAYETCDIALEHFHSSHVTFILLMKAILKSMAGDHIRGISLMNNLISEIHFNSICYVIQAHMYFLLGKSYMKRGNYEDAIQSLKHASVSLRHHTSQPLSMISLITGWKFHDLEIRIQQHQCEALRAAGHMDDACDFFFDMVKLFDGQGYACRLISEWVSNFVHQCLCTPDGPKAVQHIKRESVHPSLVPATYASLLTQWAKALLTNCSWRDALMSSVSFVVPRYMVYQALCEHLDTMNQITDAINCFRQMTSQIVHNLEGRQAEWIFNFRSRCCRKLEALGDAAMTVQQYAEAISQYSMALSLEPPTLLPLLEKRSEAYAARGMWDDALNDANQVITLDPSLPFGYEKKYNALCGAGRYVDAIEAFNTMRSKLARSTDPKIRERSRQYVDPETTEAAIRKAVHAVIRDLPRVLINTDSGHLCSQEKQTSAFESSSIFAELISTMMRGIDHGRIELEVEKFYRYATFSHTWEDNEPLFEKVLPIAVYDLDDFPTHNKLKMFCNLARDAGFRWAWSDTCCINKVNCSVLQEALVSMFKWYQGSSLTIVFLLDVRSPSRRGDLVRSVWNTRAWTLQEYHASRVVRFYNEDWTPYLNLDVPNHKESQEIISEMEEAMGISAQTLTSLRPDLHHIREKLRLASVRQTLRVEDEAYSLLGLFSMSLPVLYGEGNQALGRLLAHLLSSSGDTSILAWTGKPGSFNSCLPAEIARFEHPLTTYIPPAIKDSEMETMITGLRASSLGSNLNLVQKLFDRLNELSPPSFTGKRLSFRASPSNLGAPHVAEDRKVFFVRRQLPSGWWRLGRARISHDRILSFSFTHGLTPCWGDSMVEASRKRSNGVARMSCPLG
ncbi:hypothetical protein JVU11DRAFT_9515 [Chiua virens]|nr:hypothetical protein JVU11DRAFT_9515 [Chiua virens]